MADPKWGNDKFTQMVKEYGEKINLISQRVEREVLEFLNSSEEVDLFKKELGKKKVG